ncbi:hypothetical protein HDE_12314 [Halotydeus destructor]|nr:hypothetical protein HDE_12314 [Halotydeus destructor]
MFSTCRVRLLQTNLIKTCSLISNVRHLASKPPPGTKKPELIFLYDENGRVIGPKHKSEAELLAKKQGHLLTAFQSKTNHKYPTFQLSSKSNDVGALDDVETKDKPDEKKPFKIEEVKKLSVTVFISDHDIDIKCRQIKKWTESMYEVKVLVTGAHGQVNLLDSIYTKFANHLPDCRLLQKVVKGTNLRFTVSPDPKNAAVGKQKPNDKVSEADSNEFVASPIELDDEELQTMIQDRLKKKR